MTRAHPSPENVHYMIGDIHGQIERLNALLDAIENRHQWKHPDQDGTLVFLGDYVDRGPDSKAVMERAMSGIAGFKSICLKGNHEDLMLRCLETDDRATWSTWTAVGGKPTLKSLGYDLERHGNNPAMLAEALGPALLQWLSSLEVYYRHADFVCVHAGLVPQVTLQQQKEKDLMWIRGTFLDSSYDFGFGVIHGHTPSQYPEVKQNRIGIDTGAGFGGALTALVVDRAWQDLIQDPTFISV